VGLLRRFVVAEASMRPALEPGDGLLAVPLRRPRRGRLCVVRRPGGGDLWLVKRIAGVPGDVVEVDGRRWPVGEGEVFVLSDDREVTRADSRRYGPLPVAGAYRVVLRVPAQRR
jgi:signal peptidase I